MTSNKAYFQLWQSGIEESYLAKLVDAGLGGSVKHFKKHLGKVLPQPEPYWESPVVEWLDLFDEKPLATIAADLLAVTEKIGRPSDLEVMLRIAIYIDPNLPRAGVGMSPATLTLMSRLRATFDLDVVPDLSIDWGG